MSCGVMLAVSSVETGLSFVSFGGERIVVVADVDDGFLLAVSCALRRGVIAP